jgi:SAM-dependent methyltransferase
MSTGTLQNDQYAEDRVTTLRNRAKLQRNTNLLYWYRQLYHEQFAGFPDVSSLHILEIGSGASPLKGFYNNVVTSDVLKLDYLDHVFDCHDIHRLEDIADASLDIIAITNVLHHLKAPIEFLQKAAAKLKPGGEIIATEPYFSILSHLIFKYAHHEPVDLDVTQPVLSEIKGPLSSANIALPWLIFVKNPVWGAQLRDQFNYEPEHFRSFSFLSYMATGGISRRIPLPLTIYRLLFRMDLTLSRRFPKIFASFFTIRLTRK